MPSGNQEPRRDPELKRKAWLAVFLGSALFWVVIALVIWQVWGVSHGFAGTSATLNASTPAS
ncbi:Uncharacterised protein [Citrobacter koseri]|uniref:Uncharacterized protein n=2 Tax=Citrobacter koseri TaxID=545 RepID=A0A447UFS0_CITKO|nr:Uncharacterised protein [Citrobacter koseri]